jgi:biotin carboxylase
LTARRPAPDGLEEYRTEGKTTIPLHLRLLNEEAFRSGEYQTVYLTELLA